MNLVLQLSSSSLGKIGLYRKVFPKLSFDYRKFKFMAPEYGQAKQVQCPVRSALNVKLRDKVLCVNPIASRKTIILSPLGNYASYRIPGVFRQRILSAIGFASERSARTDRNISDTFYIGFHLAHEQSADSDFTI